MVAIVYGDSYRYRDIVSSGGFLNQYGRNGLGILFGAGIAHYNDDLIYVTIHRFGNADDSQPNSPRFGVERRHLQCPAVSASTGCIVTNSWEPALDASN